MLHRGSVKTWLYCSVVTAVHCDALCGRWLDKAYHEVDEDHRIQRHGHLLSWLPIIEPLHSTYCTSRKPVWAGPSLENVAGIPSAWQYGGKPSTRYLPNYFNLTDEQDRSPQRKSKGEKIHPPAQKLSNENGVCSTIGRGKRAQKSCSVLRKQ
jgi:hypothetical protein